MDDQDIHAKELASFCSVAMKTNRLSQHSSLEEFIEIAEKLDTFSLDKSGCIRDGVLTALDCVDVAIYRHPDIADDLKLGMQCLLLALVEAGAEKMPEEVKREIHSMEVNTLARARLSEIARAAAEQRHKESNQQKAAALAEWEANGSNYSSMAAFARHRHKEYEVTERTLYGWVRDHCKAMS